MVNKKILNPSECVSFVVDYFRSNFSEYNLVKEGSYTGYWWVNYENGSEKIGVYFDGDISGSFSVKITIDKTEYHLWQYDRSVNNASESNIENLSYQLQILKRFLSQRPNDKV